MSEEVANAEPLVVRAAGAAKMLSVSERHFYKMHAYGRVPKPIRFGRSVRWNVSELREWVQAGSPPRAKWEAIKQNSRARTR